MRSEIVWALKNVSFEVKPGEGVGIIGRNGAGNPRKSARAGSTLLRFFRASPSRPKGAWSCTVAWAVVGLNLRKGFLAANRRSPPMNNCRPSSAFVPPAVALRVRASKQFTQLAAYCPGRPAGQRVRLSSRATCCMLSPSQNANTRRGDAL